MKDILIKLLLVWPPFDFMHAFLCLSCLETTVNKEFIYYPLLSCHPVTRLHSCCTVA